MWLADPRNEQARATTRMHKARMTKEQNNVLLSSGPHLGFMLSHFHHLLSFWGRSARNTFLFLCLIFVCRAMHTYCSHTSINISAQATPDHVTSSIPHDVSLEREQKG